MPIKKNIEACNIDKILKPAIEPIHYIATVAQLLCAWVWLSTLWEFWAEHPKVLASPMSYMESRYESFHFMERFWGSPQESEIGKLAHADTTVHMTVIGPQFFKKTVFVLNHRQLLRVAAFLVKICVDKAKQLLALQKMNKILLGIMCKPNANKERSRNCRVALLSSLPSCK